MINLLQTGNKQNSDSIFVNKSINKKNLALPAILSTVGAIGGYNIPFYKTIDSSKNYGKPYVDTFDYPPESDDAIMARIKRKIKKLNNPIKTEQRRSKVVVEVASKQPNHPLKILFAIIGAILGLYAGKKINYKLYSKTQSKQ